MSDRGIGAGEDGGTAVLQTQPLVPQDPNAPTGIVLPTKQRRPKRKQVKRACTNCRKSHSGCDDLRPCTRCIDNGLESSCADVPRKKRATRRKNPSDPSDIGDGSMMTTPSGMVCHDRTCQETHNGLVNMNMGLASRARGDLGTGMMSIGVPNASAPMATLIMDPGSGLPPSVLSHPLRLKAEADQSAAASQLANQHSQTKASDIAAGMNKANNYQSLVTELSDLRRYNTRLEHTLQNILVEVQQLRSRTDVRVKSEPSDQLTPGQPGLTDTISSPPLESSNAVVQFHSFGNEVPGIATWRVHDSTLLECNDRFMEIVQQPLEVLKNNFKCLQLFPQRLYEEFINFKQAVLYGGSASNPSKETYFISPDGREKPVVMTLQALKHEEHVSPQFMVMHVVELPTNLPSGGEATDFVSTHVHRSVEYQHSHPPQAPENAEGFPSSASVPANNTATVTSITEVNPSALHVGPDTSPSSKSTTSLTSTAPALPTLTSPSVQLPSVLQQPLLQGQQQPNGDQSLLLSPSSTSSTPSSSTSV